MRLLLHAFLITAAFVGSDIIANGGATTHRLARSMDASVVWNEVKLQNYHVAATIRQGIYENRPQLRPRR
jgi:hypothetical protein